jgi:hypothetical protein
VGDNMFLVGDRVKIMKSAVPANKGLICRIFRLNEYPTYTMYHLSCNDEEILEPFSRFELEYADMQERLGVYNWLSR